MKFTNYYIFNDDLDAHGIEYSARHTAELGFDSVEFLDFYSSEKNILPDRIDVDEAKRVLDSYGLSVACYSVGINVLELGREKSFDLLMRHAEAASRLGSPFLHHTLVFPLNLPKDAPSYDAVFEAVVSTANAVADGCRELGITCLYEPQGMYFNGVEGLCRFYKRISDVCENVGICGDMGNPVFVDEDPCKVISALAPHIRHVHIKDYLVTDTLMDEAADYISRGGKYIYEMEPGEGTIDLKKCFDSLINEGYDDAIAFEFFADDDRIKNGIEYVRSLINNCERSIIR